MNIAIFADKYVGEQCLEYLLKNYFWDVKYIVAINGNEKIKKIIQNYEFNKKYFLVNSDLNNPCTIKKLYEAKLDYIILAWWPNIINKEIISIPKYGVINFHPSLLPYCRGKNPNFWSIIEEVPYGVTIHFIDEGIDSGDILFQRKIEKKWSDTGETLYKKAIKEIIALFKESYPKIISMNYARKKQKKDLVTMHYGKELELKSQIILDKEYKARELLNLLRARTFDGYPACYFFENNRKYEIKISINEVK